MTRALSSRVWFTTRQAAEYAGMHPKTVRNACEDGTLRAGQRATGGHWRIHRDDLDAWLSGATSSAAS